ncbi:MAG: class I SAM-dependent methyltransferase [Chloroflexi bacterium]|nr:class I SAM-dependent methyltransferase [Chloroflexota bacterium]
MKSVPDYEALREPHTALLRAALELASPPGARVALDLACGHGTTTSWLAAQSGPGALVVGLDHDGAALHLARLAHPAAQFVQADAHRLPLRSASADLVWCVAALGLFADPGGALAEVRRVLRPGGVLVVASATQRWVRLRHWPAALAAGLAGPPPTPPADELGAELEALLHAAGLKAIALQAYLLAPAGLAPRAALLPLLSWQALAPLAANLDPATQAACLASAAAEPEAEPRPVLLVAMARSAGVTG